MASKLPVVTQKLFTPPLDEIAQVLQKGLFESFAEVQVRVVDCPNLTQTPFNLAAEGLCGKPRIADIGGVKNLLPLPARDKIYNLNTIADLVDLPGAFMIGAGAGPFHQVGTCCEFMANIRTQSSTSEGSNNSYIAKVNPKSKACELLQLPDSTDFSLMLNVLASEGKPGKVLEVKVSERVMETNFVSCMREALNDHYGTQPVGLGGAFLIKKGQARLHVMPDFSKTPLNDETVNSWLKFYDMKAPLVCLSVFVSHDPGLDLRIEHTHCFSDHDEGGHYHDDTTPLEVEYVGYFVPADILYRIDRP